MAAGVGANDPILLATLARKLKLNMGDLIDQPLQGLISKASDDEVEAVSRKWRETNLEKDRLDLSERKDKITSREFTLFVGCNQDLQTLILNGCVNISLPALRAKPLIHLTSLALSKMNIGDSMAADLATSLGSLPTLTFLDLTSNKLTDAALPALIPTFQRLTRLVSLLLNENKIQPQGIRLLESSLYAPLTIDIAQLRQKPDDGKLRKAQAGDAKAQHELALSFFASRSDPKSVDPIAMEWLTTSADQGYLPAILECGYHLWNGDGVGKDMDAAFERFKQAAGVGSGEGMYWAGHYAKYLAFHHNNRGHMQNAIEWLEKAAELNHGRAIADLTEFRNLLETRFGTTRRTELPGGDYARQLDAANQHYRMRDAQAHSQYLFNKH